MNMRKIAIETATNPQLFRFASVTLGLDIRAGTNTTTLLAKIREVDAAITHIDVPIGDGDTGKPQMAAASGDGDDDNGSGLRFPALPPHDMRNDPVVKINVQQDETSKDPHCAVAVQGKAVLIVRGMDIDVPYRVFLALQQAKQGFQRPTAQVNPETREPIMEWVDRHTYPHSVLRMPTNEEIALFHARTDHVSLSAGEQLLADAAAA